MNPDLIIFKAFNNLVGKCDIFDKFVIFCAEYLGYIYLLIIGFILLKNFKKNIYTIIEICISAFLARIVIAEIIRYIFYTDRPFVNFNVNQLLHHSASASFPSGHAIFFFAVSISVFLWNREWGIIGLLVSALMSLARIYGGIHWPSDILIGAGLGILVAIGVNKLMKYYLKQKNAR
ncbi:MAG: phosphatase PAP2 family protein [Candidatus Pacebacteria bacterium]|nr:phosphatase PAP2 family protein [Candidatus Paceibacterota bacterium]MDD5621349.1 phosphatase PAP2 family protein [Candidatus Paceibacterota bacterium]